MKKFLTIMIATMIVFSIAACGDRTNTAILGTFYTLREAYDNNYISNNDLIVIANYYQGDALTDTKDSLSINSLDGKMKKQIVKCYLLNIINDINVPDEYVNIYAYYGTYNNAVAIGITDTYNVYDLFIIEEYKVGDVILYNYAESDILIWVK